MKVEIGKAKQNGSVPIYIRLAQDRKVKRVRFYMDATEKDITPSGEIKNLRLEMAVQDEMQMYRRKLYDAGVEVMEWDIDRVANYLVNNGERKEEAFKLDFIDFGREIERSLVKEGREKTAESYRSSINTFVKFLGKNHIDINEINKAMMVKMMDWFAEHNYGPRAVELYMSVLQTIHNKAKEKYNDEDDTNPKIKYSPFKQIKFKRSKADRSLTEKRALSPTALRYLYNVPTGNMNIRCVMARDAFFLSFGLCGMNSIDMMLHVQDKDCPEDKIEYYRKKIALRSGEDAFISMHVHPFFMDIHRRLRGVRHTWMFGEKYSTSNNLNCALNLGLRDLVDAAVVYYGNKWQIDPYENRAELLKRLELPDDLTFYAARHSFATIAANDCGVPTEIIDRCLCHVVKSVAVQSYIKKDYRFTDETVAKVVKVVFGDVISS